MSEIYTLTLEDPEYPRLLLEIPNPPEILYVRGAIPDMPMIAVVGTRRCTAYGIQVTDAISADLARSGIGVVSGLALGIDAVAHEATLRVGGVTIAVLGSGVDEHNIYPASHRMLAEKIIKQGGAVISEYAPGSKPAKYTFPERNRIIAGISLGTLVTEAPQESGALITAYHALDYNREVFAVPHPVTSIMGVGCNRLIKHGAKLTENASAIAESLNIILEAKPTIKLNLDPKQDAVYNLLASNSFTIEEIISKSQLPSYEVLSILSMLEIKGLIRSIAGRYIKNQ